MIEIEKKYRLSEEERRFVITALGEIGSEFAGEDFEENVVYNGGALNGKTAILRVRKTAGKTLLTYKERLRTSSEFKQQIEHETEVADSESLKSIVETLGFTPQVIYEKRRKIWKLRNVEVVVDELPFGLFMEIEGAISGIKEAEMLLNIEKFEVESSTYPTLAEKFGVLRNGIIESRFT